LTVGIGKQLLHTESAFGPSKQGLEGLGFVRVDVEVASNCCGEVLSALLLLVGWGRESDGERRDEGAPEWALMELVHRMGELINLASCFDERRNLVAEHLLVTEVC